MLNTIAWCRVTRASKSAAWSGSLALSAASAVPILLRDIYEKDGAPGCTAGRTGLLGRGLRAGVRPHAGNLQQGRLVLRAVVMEFVGRVDDEAAGRHRVGAGPGGIG